MDKRRIKLLWRGVFNLNKQVFTLYAHAYTERQAWMIFCKRLSDKHDIGLNHVMNFFNGEKDNYEIKIEREYQEE